MEVENIEKVVVACQALYEAVSELYHSKDGSSKMCHVLIAWRMKHRSDESETGDFADMIDKALVIMCDDYLLKTS